MSPTSKRSGFLIAGVALVGIGLILLAVPRNLGFAVWLGRVWPLFLVLAGLFRVIGFAIERRPRSPLGGALLAAVGLVLLASRIEPESNLFAIYGKYWIVVLGIYSLAEMVRFYSHRQGDGAQPRLFSIPKLLMVMLIAGTGILSSRVAGSRKSMLSMLRIPSGQSSLTDSGTLQTYTFEDPPSLAETGDAATATINNSRGDINIVGGTRSLRVILSKSVTALGEAEAHNLADQIKLVVERTPGGIRIGTNREQVNGDFTTNMRIEVPRGLALAVNSSKGSVLLKGSDGPVSISALAGAVSVAQIAGDVDIVLNGSSSLDASSVVGNLSVEGAKDARISNISGGLNLKANNGSIDLRDVRGPVKLDAPTCRIKAANLFENSTIKSGSSTIDVTRSASLVIEGPGSTITAQQVNGDLQINSSDGSVRLTSVQGGVTLSVSRSTVLLDGLNGETRVKASYAPVSVKNMRGSAFIETSYDRILIIPGEAITDIQAKNSHGDIRMALPESSEFQLIAEATSGLIKCPSLFGHPNQTGLGANLFYGGSGPRIALTTVDGNIVLEQAGSRRHPN